MNRQRLSSQDRMKYLIQRYGAFVTVKDIEENLNSFDINIKKEYHDLAPKDRVARAFIAGLVSNNPQSLTDLWEKARKGF